MNPIPHLATLDIDPAETGHDPSGGPSKRRTYQRLNGGLARRLREWLAEHPGEHHQDDIAAAISRTGFTIHTPGDRNPGQVIRSSLNPLMDPDSRYHLPGLSRVGGRYSGTVRYEPVPGAVAPTPAPKAKAPTIDTPATLTRIGTDTDGNPLMLDTDSRKVYRILFEEVT